MDLRYRLSLARRLRAAHSLYRDAVASMDETHVNAVVVANVLPIAFSLVHQVLIEDFSRAVLSGEAVLFDDAWRARLDLALADDGKARTVEEMMAQRIGDYRAFVEFQSLVFDATESYVDRVDPESLSEVIVGYPYGATLENTFSARVGATDGITRSDAIESWIYQHALRHMGEIEHARALVGLGGMTS